MYSGIEQAFIAGDFTKVRLSTFIAGDFTKLRLSTFIEGDFTTVYICR